MVNNHMLQPTKLENPHRGYMKNLQGTKSQQK